MDDGGLEKFNKWGWCGEGCPLEGSDTTWGTDETLTVTTEFVKKTDPDIYKTMIGLGILAIALVIMAAVIKFFGIFKYSSIVTVLSISFLLQTRQYLKLPDGSLSRLEVTKKY